MQHVLPKITLNIVLSGLNSTITVTEGTKIEIKLPDGSITELETVNGSWETICIIELLSNQEITATDKEGNISEIGTTVVAGQQEITTLIITTTNPLPATGQNTEIITLSGAITLLLGTLTILANKRKTNKKQTKSK